VIKQETDTGEKHLYIKTFKRTPGDGVITILNVVVDKGGIHYSISTHQKELNNLLRKIKKAEDIVFEKTEYLDRTGGNGDKPLAITGDNHLPIVSPKPPEKSSL
jgi:hypothetical protein